jgi:hypothetical protein
LHGLDGVADQAEMGVRMRMVAESDIEPPEEDRRLAA